MCDSPFGRVVRTRRQIGTPPAPSAIDASGAGAAGASVEVSSTDLGDILVDGEGRTLYLFTPDGTGTPTCVDTCAAAWPPLVSNGEPAVEGIEEGVVGTVTSADGTSQVTAGGRPLYTYGGDTAPGDTTGQGSGGNWFVVGADGNAIDTTDSSGGSGY